MCVCCYLKINRFALSDEKRAIQAPPAELCARHLVTKTNTKFFKCCMSIEFTFEQY